MHQKATKTPDFVSDRTKPGETRWSESCGLPTILPGDLATRRSQTLTNHENAVNYAPQNAAVISFNPADADATRLALGNYGFKVEEFSSIEDCRRALRAGGSSDALLAILAGIDTESLARQFLANLKRSFPDLPVMVAATSATVAHAVESMKQGASDVVALPCTEEQLREKIRQLMDEASQNRLVNSERVEFRNRLAELTPAEVSVLDLLLDGFANKQISQELNIGLRTVELRRSKIMAKMHASSVAQLIKMVCIARGHVDPSDSNETKTASLK